MESRHNRHWDMEICGEIGIDEYFDTAFSRNLTNLDKPILIEIINKLRRTASLTVEFPSTEIKREALAQVLYLCLDRTSSDVDISRVKSIVPQGVQLQRSNRIVDSRLNWRNLILPPAWSASQQEWSFQWRDNTVVLMECESRIAAAVVSGIMAINGW